MISRIHAALNLVRRDGRITEPEWAKLEPELEKTPRQANPVARRIIQLVASDELTLVGAVKDKVQGYLLSRGYEVPAARRRGQTAAQFAQEIARSNITEVDTDYQRLLERTGKAHVTTLVAVLDSGWDRSHPAIRDDLWVNAKDPEDDEDNDLNGLKNDTMGWDFVDNDNTLETPDNANHANHVAGIVSAGRPNVDVLAIRAFSPLNAQSIGKAIDYAAQNGAKVMNMSFLVRSKDVRTAIVDAMKRHPDVLFVASAGTDGRDINSYDATTYLKKTVLPNFAVVAAGNPDGTAAGYSNFGVPYATHAARGSDVVSCTKDGQYAPMSGTSMASPCMAGLAAAVRNLDDALTPEQIKELTALTSTPSPVWTGRTVSGGLLNANAATRLAALTGLVRKGKRLEDAAAEINLTSKERAQLFPLVTRLVSTNVS